MSYLAGDGPAARGDVLCEVDDELFYVLLGSLGIGFSVIVIFSVVPFGHVDEGGAEFTGGIKEFTKPSTNSGPDRWSEVEGFEA